MLHHTVQLRNTTYCAIDGRINIPTQIKLMVAYAEFAHKHILFDSSIILTPKDNHIEHPYIKFIDIERLKSFGEYSNFCIKRLPDYIETEYCLLYQWDGCISNPELWKDEFLDYDYVGAPWGTKHNGMVGNGGFSLRSKRLLDECARYPYDGNYVPEDLHICYKLRPYLANKGIRIADFDTAKKFAIENQAGKDHTFDTTFGFHMGRTGMRENFIKFVKRLRDLQLL